MQDFSQQQKWKADKHALSLTDILYGELLADPDIEFDTTETRVISPLEPIVLSTYLQQDEPDFGAGAIERARRGDFRGAEAALDFAERTGRIDERTVDLSRAKVEEHRSLAQQTFEHGIGRNKRPIGRRLCGRCTNACDLRTAAR